MPRPSAVARAARPPRDRGGASFGGRGAQRQVGLAGRGGSEGAEGERPPHSTARPPPHSTAGLLPHRGLLNQHHRRDNYCCNCHCEGRSKPESPADRSTPASVSPCTVSFPMKLRWEADREYSVIALSAHRSEPEGSGRCRARGKGAMHHRYPLPGPRPLPERSVLPRFR